MYVRHSAFVDDVATRRALQTADRQCRQSTFYYTTTAPYTAVIVCVSVYVGVYVFVCVCVLVYVIQKTTWILLCTQYVHKLLIDNKTT